MADVLDALGTIVGDRAAYDQAGRSDVADVLQSGVKMHLGRHREGRAQAADGLSASREIGDALNSGLASSCWAGKP